MNYFLDTSALVKYFHQEAGSDVVESVIDSGEHEIWTLDIARVEFLCSLHRRFREHNLSEADLAIAIDGFNDAINEFHIEKTGTPIIVEAENLVKQYGKEDGLRTLDALHLASFSLLANTDWVFMASDYKLCSVVKKMGYSVLNPIEK